MKQLFLILLVGLSIWHIDAQEVVSEPEPAKVLDSLYREDQFYVGLTFNLLSNRPADVNQSGFSGGMHFGFIRDMPINKRRNVAIGLGLGYSFNTYGQNLFIGEEEGTDQSIFSSLKGIDFNTNRFVTHIVEAPLEFRWRTSVADTHKFYRIYTGIKVGYLYAFRSNFEQTGNRVRQTKIEELNRWRYGAMFTFGWNTVNFHFYYNLNPLFNDEAKIDGENVGLNSIKIGLMFYIL
ncbi:porin family protein [Aquimarina sp. 2201CG5-10]|uniref:porin family protein n=1 Tax=Aquimarina callyspongiae TaxID=3098150 RepID=UPI002AB58F24|nr:porin family protein [Aquimarina sp. 2201CG5-10]MDY8136779.1 porin family protein [Aquimarina sp. 2201CG5-10]